MHSSSKSIKHKTAETVTRGTSPVLNAFEQQNVL